MGAGNIKPAAIWETKHARAFMAQQFSNVASRSHHWGARAFLRRHYYRLAKRRATCSELGQSKRAADYSRVEEKENDNSTEHVPP